MDGRVLALLVLVGLVTDMFSGRLYVLSKLMTNFDDFF